MHKKALLFGLGPLPFEKAQYNSSGGARFWAFIEEALKLFTKNQIDILLLGATPFYKFSQLTENKPHIKVINGFKVTIVSEALAFNNYLESLVNSGQYSSISSVCTYPSYFISRINKINIPWWADLYGDPIVEGQSKAYTYNDNLYMHNMKSLLEPIIKKADYFTVCSERQKYVLIGELAISGRLTKENEGIDLVNYVPIPFFENSHRRSRTNRNGNFKLLWIGGYNTWADTKTLFNGLYIAMKTNPKIRFISTGGSIKGHDTITYETFAKVVNNCELKNNMDLLGYVSQEKLISLLKECDLGLNVDRYNYEGLIGGRTRVNTFIEYKLPTLTTNLSEIPKTMEENKLAITFNPGDYADLSRKILWAANHRDKLAKMTNKAYAYFKNYYVPHRYLSKYRDWLLNPTFTDKDITSFYNEAVYKPRRRDKLVLYNILKYGYLNALKSS